MSVYEPVETVETPPNPEDLKGLLNELDMTPSKLASRMRQLGDYRCHSAIVRSLQRALSGQTVISGELFVIIQMLLHQRRRYQKENSRVNWMAGENRGICATIRGFKISLYANRNGLWQIHVIQPERGYSHPFPMYPDNLESAKLKALQCVEEAEEILQD